MYKDVLRGIEGIGIFPVISFVIFFVFFILLTGYLLTMRKDHIARMEQLPLEEDEPESKQIQSHEKDLFR